MRNSSQNGIGVCYCLLIQLASIRPLYWDKHMYARVLKVIIRGHGFEFQDLTENESMVCLVVRCLRVDKIC